MKNRLLVLIHVFFACQAHASGSKPQNDAQAYDYCIDNKKSFIAVVWPIAQGKDAEILSILDSFGDIIYQKKVYFTYDQVSHLLAQAHPKVKDIESHVAWYFPPGTFEKPARVFVMQFRNYKTADACKHAIRRLFGMQYRPIHINDYHYETIELAEFFFNGNKTKNPFFVFGSSAA